MESLTTTANANIEELLDKILDYLKTPKFWISLGILIVAVILWQVLRRVRKNYFKKNGKEASTASHVAFDIARYIFIFVVLIVLMQLNGINVTALVTGLGIFSIIVGLALQDFLKDIIMGAHILSDKFFKVGDVIRYGDVEGEVISFNIRTTKIQLVSTFDIMTISNRNLDQITVLSDVVDLDISIPYNIDPKKVNDTMRIITKQIKKVDLVTDAVYKGTCAFKESAVAYKLRYWTSPKATRYEVSRSVHRIVQEQLIAAGIPFAYNHLNVEFVNPQILKDHESQEETE
ncbi:MAG: mechanosensitive ion channel family protein [Parasporobacterium sp.]|nr:mechanosensitive ion channel family protein [Parasporobacterium sp.]